MTLEFPFYCGTKERVGGWAMMQPRATLELARRRERKFATYAHWHGSTVGLRQHNANGWARVVETTFRYCSILLKQCISAMSICSGGDCGASRYAKGYHLIRDDANECEVLRLTTFSWSSCLALGTPQILPVAFSPITLSSSGKPDSIGRSGWQIQWKWIQMSKQLQQKITNTNQNGVSGVQSQPHNSAVNRTAQQDCSRYTYEHAHVIV